jgi:hypothetical protein
MGSFYVRRCMASVSCGRKSERLLYFLRNFYLPDECFQCSGQRGAPTLTVVTFTEGYDNLPTVHSEACLQGLLHPEQEDASNQAKAARI